MSSRASPQAETGLPARVLLGIFFLALAVRLGAALELAQSPWTTVPLGDARAYDDWGRAIAAGDWLGHEVFYQAPLYPYFLGTVYAVCGHAPLVVRGVQILWGALAAVLLALAAARLLGPRAGWIAGLALALYAPAIAADLELEKTSLAVLLSALVLWIASTRAGSARAALAAGAGLGALTLLRENSAVLLVPLAFAFGAEPRAARLAALGAGFALVLLPVGLRNLALGGAFLPTAANAGVNFYIGNGAEADGLYRPLVAGRGHPDYEREDAARIARALSGRELTPAEVSGFWFARAGSEIAAEPGHFAGLLARKTRLLAQHGEIMDAVALESLADESWILRALAPLSFGLWFPLALAGAVLAWPRRAARLALAAAGLLALSIVAFFVVGRFRLPLLPFLLPFAGFALAELRDLCARPLALAAAAAGALLAWTPPALPGDARATADSNLASEYLRRGAYAEAERWARSGRELDPSCADCAFNLGMALRHEGENERAREPLEAAMRLEPAYSADVLAELGALRALAGDSSGARELLERALTLDPAHAAARRYLDTLDGSKRAPGSR